MNVASVKTPCNLHIAEGFLLGFLVRRLPGKVPRRPTTLGGFSIPNTSLSILLPLTGFTHEPATMMPLPQLPSAHPPPSSSSLQVIEDRYIDEDKLLNICKQKFGAGNYHLRVSKLLGFMQWLYLFLATLISHTRSSRPRFRVSTVLIEVVQIQ
jgi:hypothetical protein